MTKPRILYKTQWHYPYGIFSHCSVDEITVEWEGIKFGCTRPVIIARDEEGNKFESTADLYFETPKAAWEAIREELRGTIEENKRDIAELEQRNRDMADFLEKIGEPTNETTKEIQAKAKSQADRV